MFLSKPFKIGEDGHLKIGGCDSVTLAEIYGTPLYVMDEGIIRENCRKYKAALERHYGGKGIVLFAGKAFCTAAMCRIAAQEGLGMDAVSGGEIFTAMKAGFPPDRIFFHGNNKTAEEIRYALKNGIGRYVIDNREELIMMEDLAAEKGVVAQVAFRIKPGIEAHTHDYIQTGRTDSKFGMGLEDGEALDIIAAASKMKHIAIKGIHCHIGSQIFELRPFELAAGVMMKLAVEIKDRTGMVIQEINLGGGYGIRYTDRDDPLEYEEYIAAVSGIIGSASENAGIDKPDIIFEPGRSIAGPAGITLYRVGSVKEVRDIRKYVAVDGGMTDNPRYALYKAKYDAVIADRADAASRAGGCETEKVTVAGRCCESGDLIGEDMELAPVKKGDILAILATGAYNYSMSSNYNRLPRPPVVLVKDGKHRLIVKRETYEDLVRNDLIPDDL